VTGKTNKTYKREVAIILLVWFAYIVETKGVDLVAVLIWPVFTYSALAFGLDWAAKPPGNGMFGRQSSQSFDRGRSERSSERPGGEDKYPDLRDDQGR